MINRNDMLIEVDELLTKIDDPNLRIFDATILFYRKEDEPTAHENYVQEHIPGAAFFEHKDFSDSSNPYMYMVLPEAKLATQIGSAGISNESEVVVYAADLLPCSTRVWWVLTYAGHKNVRVLNGGLTAWKNAGGALAQGAETYPPATFSPNMQPGMMANKDDVLAAMENGAVCTVNTLNQESYDQAHIQGSSLLPAMGLMDEQMATFQHNEVLLTTLAGEMAYEKVITYCGGGFAATVNAMAHLMVGNANVAVYDGSMSEWAGEKLPMIKAEG